MCIYTYIMINTNPYVTITITIIIIITTIIMMIIAVIVIIITTIIIIIVTTSWPAHAYLPHALYRLLVQCLAAPTRVV